MNSMFSFCENLSFIPGIDRWNIKKVKDVKRMFYGCKKLNSLPEKFKEIIQNDKIIFTEETLTFRLMGKKMKKMCNNIIKLIYYLNFQLL